MEKEGKKAEKGVLRPHVMWKDARVLLNSAINTVSVPQCHILFNCQQRYLMT